MLAILEIASSSSYAEPFVEVGSELFVYNKA
jgi:hypothetical protein